MWQEELRPNTNERGDWIILNEWFQSKYNSNSVRSMLKTSDCFSNKEAIKDIFNNPDFIRYSHKINFEALNNIIMTIKNINIFRYIDHRYPKLLRTIPDPPPIIYHKGKLTNFDSCIAIAGTRDPSHYAHKMARTLAKTFARKGYTIVSGLAKGVDTEAHCGALDVNGKTIAVLGTKIIDEIYPKENSRLANDILKTGAIISEAPLFKSTQQNSFIKRNRIISGLSKYVIIVEFGSSNGSYMQVKHAIKQARKVFVLKPKNNDEIAMKGYKSSIKEGAIPFKTKKELLKYIEVDKSTTKLGSHRWITK